MQALVRSALVFALLACNTPRASEQAAAAADLFTRQHSKHALQASVGGSDCRVLLITSETAFEDDQVESIQYGVDHYDAFGGAEQFARDRGFRAVVYRDPAGAFWTYGATTRDEAQSMTRCR